MLDAGLTRVDLVMMKLSFLRLPASVVVWVYWLARWGVFGLAQVAFGVLILWAALAIYFSNLPWFWPRAVLAVGFVGFSVWAVWVTRQRRMRWVFGGVFGAVVVWFAAIPPSHDRPWRPEVAVMPRAYIEGNTLRVTGVRNFEFRSRDDFTVRHEERTYDLSRVASLDLFISYWKPGPVAHTFVSFNFDDGSLPLCVSIETRTEVGEGFAPLQSMFKQFELIYIVGDEHDMVGLRASHRNEQVYLYRIRASPQAVRNLLDVYVQRINQLADRPEWYHLLKNNCGVNIFRHANTAGRGGRFDIRQLLNGWVDRYLFDVGLLDSTMTFAELRQRSNITQAAQEAAGAADFSDRIRVGLVIPRHTGPVVGP